ncbi:MAG: CpXC domain-containing protein, partial [Chloroflexia bacterium]
MGTLTEKASLTCPRCGRPFEVEICLTLDAAARPDLLARAQAGALHAFTCPHCGHEGEVDAPLLIYRAGQEPALLFSPARHTTAEEDRKQAAGLLSALRERLGEAWREERVERVQIVPREFLPVALSDGPEAALRRMAEEAAAAVERLRREDPEAYRRWEEATQEAAARLLAAAPFVAGVQALLEADSMTALLQVARDHPALLEPEAEARIREMAQAARDGGQAELAQVLEERYRALRRTQQTAGASGPALEKTAKVIEKVEKTAGAKSSIAPPQLSMAQTLQQFIQADTWAESRRILEAHPELLSAEADALLEQLVQAALAQGDENARRIFEEHRALLRRCREVGIEQAFAEIGGGPAAPAELQDDLRRAQEGESHYLRTGDPAALDQAVAAWERILDHPAFAQAEERFRLAAWNDAGVAFIRRFQALGHLSDLDAAMSLLQQAVAHTSEGSPDWAKWQANLGGARIRRFEALGQVADLDAAIEAYGKALAVAREGSPDWA